jgi:hypothetical protein
MSNKRWRSVALWLCVCLSLDSLAWANETDQFTLPPREEFVDLGPLISQIHLQVLDRVTAELNRRIDRAMKLRDPERSEALAALHSPAAAADRIRLAFGPGMSEMNQLEWVLDAGRGKKLFPGKRLGYRTMLWIYADAHLPFDPRKLPLLFPSSTIRLYDSFMGADKLGHFHDLGHIYFKRYLALRAQGLDDAQAQRSTVLEFSRGPISEDAVIGRLATGVRSNADLAANYIGYKFYRNLTETTRIAGRDLPPLMVRDGMHWRLNDHVLPYSDFMRPYFSDHFNEALNPCQYEWSMRDSIRRRLQKTAAEIRAFYVDKHGLPRTREAFEHLALELSTYHGEDYGFMGDPLQGVTIANSCFESESAERTKLAAGEGER